MDRRLLVSYILLNIFVSACVTGGILFWYDRNVKATSSSIPPQTDPATGEAIADSDPALVEIVSVIGADNLSAETVILRYVGEGQLDLSNWQLKDESGNLFLFPAVTLIQNGAVQIHTASGASTPIDLYWGMTSPVWKSGETASLYDAIGNLIVTFKVP
ncbi:MAG: hypothetical protein HFACDABA_00545 [Anaerolineales bacterium]|nr:hypothetical protein [Anaerolineales bacterium]